MAAEPGSEPRQARSRVLPSPPGTQPQGMPSPWASAVPLGPCSHGARASPSPTPGENQTILDQPGEETEAESDDVPAALREALHAAHMLFY